MELPLAATPMAPRIGTLCCGRSGRAYALLNLYRHTDETAWHERARDLALRAAAHAADGVEQGRVDSLYKGLLGVSLLAAEIEVPTQARMPFFEPEGWPKRKTLPLTPSS